MSAAHFVNPVITDDVGRDHGDPFVLQYLGEYFLYHTTDDGKRGISVHRSTDLVNWTFEGFALEAGGPDHWAQTDLWAPEIIYWSGTFYMYVSGALKGEAGETIEASRRQGLARASQPLGPFTFDDQPLVRDDWSIDGHPFLDEDGSLWLFYNTRTEATRFRGKPGSGNVVDRLLEPDRLEGQPSVVTFPSQPWEGGLNGEGYWNEGSWVLKRRGRYYQLYSGGDYRDSSYGIGLSAAQRPRGQWEKNPGNPIFRSGERIRGPGHHSVILAADGVSYYSVYHAYDGERTGRKVHLDPLIWAGDRPLIGVHPVTGRPTEAPQTYPPGPAFDPSVPYWHADLWLRGRQLRIDGVEIELDELDSPWRVRASQGRDGLRVWVDGRLHTQQLGAHLPELSWTGELEHMSLTSHLSDETVRWLSPGERHVWPWNGTRAVDIYVAVMGSARLIVGDAVVELISPEDQFAAFHHHGADGAADICVEGFAPGAQVTDLAVTTR